MWKFPCYEIRLRCPHPELKTLKNNAYHPKTLVQLVGYYFEKDPVGYVFANNRILINTPIKGQPNVIRFAQRGAISPFRPMALVY